MGSIQARLIRDHDHLEAELEELVDVFELGDWLSARAAYEAFERRLRAHFEVEEQLLYPELARMFPREARALMDEHGVIRRRVDELGIGIDVHQTRVTEIEALATLIRHHGARENRLLAPFSDEQASLDAASSFSHGRSPAPPERS